jgi:hypothetical protein
MSAASSSSRSLRIDVERIKGVGSHVPINAPPEVLPTAACERDGEGSIREPLHHCEYELGVWTPTCNHFSEINAVVE